MSDHRIVNSTPITAIEFGVASSGRELVPVRSAAA